MDNLPDPKSDALPLYIVYGVLASVSHLSMVIVVGCFRSRLLKYSEYFGELSESECITAEFVTLMLQDVHALMHTLPTTFLAFALSLLLLTVFSTVWALTLQSYRQKLGQNR